MRKTEALNDVIYICVDAPWGKPVGMNRQRSYNPECIGGEDCSIAQANIRCTEIR